MGKADDNGAHNDAILGIKGMLDVATVARGSGTIIHYYNKIGRRMDPFVGGNFAKVEVGILNFGCVASKEKKKIYSKK